MKLLYKVETLKSESCESTNQVWCLASRIGRKMDNGPAENLCWAEAQWIVDLHAKAGFLSRVVAQE